MRRARNVLRAIPPSPDPAETLAAIAGPANIRSRP